MSVAILLGAVALVVSGAAAPMAVGKTFARIGSQKVEARSADGRCVATVLYPKVEGLANPAVQERVNRFLMARWLGKDRAELRGAAGDCHSAYLSSVGFFATLSPTGVLSVKRTRSVMRGDNLGGTVEQECHIVDLRRGGKIEITTWLGPTGVARLARLAKLALQKRFLVNDLTRAGFVKDDLELAKGNFSACFEGDELVVQIGPEHVTGNERGAVEVRVSLSVLGKTAP